VAALVARVVHVAAAQLAAAGNEADNLICICRECNSKMGTKPYDLYIEEYKKKLNSENNEESEEDTYGTLDTATIVLDAKTIKKDENNGTNDDTPNRSRAGTVTKNIKLNKLTITVDAFLSLFCKEEKGCKMVNTELYQMYVKHSPTCVSIQTFWRHIGKKYAKKYPKEKSKKDVLYYRNMKCTYPKSVI
jgi:hypothetical protein